jgi:hypothetical protein
VGCLWSLVTVFLYCTELFSLVQSQDSGGVFHKTYFTSKNKPPWQIQDGNRDTEVDCVSCVNQGPCWDAGDMLGWGKEPGRAKTLAPWTPSSWKASPRNDLLKEQLGKCPPGLCPMGMPRPHPAGLADCRSTRPPSHRCSKPLHCRPARPLLCQATHLQVCWATPHRSAGLPLQKSCALQACCYPQEGSNTTRFQLQTFIGEIDRQDWMLKE